MSSKSHTIIFHFLTFILLATATSLLYANTLNVPFFFDDKPNILLNPYLRIENLNWENLKLVAIKSPNSRRWLPNITFALNHYFDGYDVWGYHLVNIIMHIFTAFIFYLLAYTTLTLPSLAGRYKHAKEIALIAALAWAFHPLQTNGVTYIVQRMTSMGALFCLSSLYCYVKARLQLTIIPKIPLFGLSLLFVVMALLSKENSGMLPLVIVLYELLLLGRPDSSHGRQKKLFAIIIIAFIAFMVVCWHFLGNNPFANILGGYKYRAFSLSERLYSQTRIVVHYLSLLALPLPGRLNIMYEFQVSTSLLSPPQTLLATSFLAALTSCIFFLRKHDRVLAFGIAWLLINLIVESTVIPLELIFEHRMYVPSMFLILSLIAWLYRATAIRLHILRGAMLLTLALLAIGTWQRNEVWGSRISFWEDAVRKSPMSMRALGNLGNAYSEAKKYKVAEEYLLKALDLEKKDQSGNFAESARRHHAANIHENLALVYRELNQYQKAIEHANISINMNPSRPEPLVTLGIIFSKTGQHAKAYEYFLLAWAKGIDEVDLYNNWAVSSFNLGKIDEAINLLQKALQIDPDHAESHYNLGIAYSSKGMLQEAQREMLRAMQLRQKR